MISSLSIQTMLGAVIAFDFFAGIFVLASNPRRSVNRSFFVFNFGTAIWGGSLLLLWIVHRNVLIDFVLYGGTIAAIGLAYLARTFPDSRRAGLKFLFIFAPLYALWAIIPSGTLIKSVEFGPEGLQPVNGPLFFLYVAVMGAYVVYSLYLFARTYRGLSGVQRLQMQYLFTGAALFAIFSIMCDAVLPAFGVFRFNILGPMSAVIFIGFTAYAIVRHELMDIRIVIQRGAIYSALFTLIVVVYLSLLLTLEAVFSMRSNLSALLGGGITAVIGIFGVPPLEGYFRKITDSVFFKDRYDYREAMRELSKVLNRNFELNALVGGLCAALKDILRIGRAEIFLRGSEPGGTGKERGVLVPIVLEDKELGILSLGEKLSGDPYTAEDMNFLKTFSYQAAVAIEKARLYEQVKMHSRELEKKVRERTLSLEELQEKQHNMMVDISHALQTPLTIVKIEFDVLKKQLPKTKDLTTFERSIDHVSRLTYDLLKLARLETSQSDFRAKPVNLSKLLCGLVEYFTVIAKDKGIEVASEIAPGLCILGDKNSLEEMATNLLSNAVKYMAPKGKKRIRISLKKMDDKASLVIADTGIGIRTEDLPNIFTRFYRAANAPSDTQGTGLGLAICKTIAEKHGGTIRAESDLGKGTTFTVVFPLEKKPHSPA